jgi:hypothetical protein
MLSMTACIHNDVKRGTPVPLGEAPASQALILVVEGDWRRRRFIGTVLKYATSALVMQAACPDAALSIARTVGRIDLLVADTEFAGAKTGIYLARELAANHPSMRVLLLAARDYPPPGIPPEWRFLSIPFPTGAFLDHVDELCYTLEPARPR